MSQIVQTLFDALSLGGMYALYSLGVALIFGVSGIINFAHGNFIALGAYALLIFGGLVWPLAALAVVAVAVAVALLTETLVFAPARKSGANSTTILIVAFAVSIGLENVLLIGFGARPQGVDFGMSLARTVNFVGFSVGAASIVTIAVVAMALSALAVILRFTAAGLLIRAAALDGTMLQLLGVSSRRVLALTIALSGALAGLASLMLVAQTGSLSLAMGVQPVLIAFIATVIGGLGSLSGAVIASFGLAIVTIALQEFLPAPVEPFRTAILFTLIIAVLLIRPDGLIRKATGARI